MNATIFPHPLAKWVYQERSQDSPTHPPPFINYGYGKVWLSDSAEASFGKSGTFIFGSGSMLSQIIWDSFPSVIWHIYRSWGDCALHKFFSFTTSCGYVGACMCVWNLARFFIVDQPHTSRGLCSVVSLTGEHIKTWDFLDTWWHSWAHVPQKG